MLARTAQFKRRLSTSSSFDTHAHVLASALFLLGIFLTTAAGAVAVKLVDAYGPVELTWLRFLSMILIYPAIVCIHPPSRLRPSRRQAMGLAILGISSLLGLYLFLVAVKGVELATATGLFFCYPFLAIVLAVFFLREPASLPVWILTALGFLGVVVLFNPHGAGLTLYSLAAVGSGVAVALKMLLTRGLGLGLPPLATATGEALVAAILLLPFLSITNAFSGALPVYLGLYLVLSNLSRILVVIALARVELSSVAPLGYAEIVFAAVLQWLAFGQGISAFEAIAFALILVAGLGVTFVRRPTRPHG